jgi:hypothetical protein
MRSDKAVGVGLCAAAMLGFVATYVVLAAAKPHATCSAGIENVGCPWPPVWAMLVGVLGTLGSFALVVTGVLALIVSAASAREVRERASLAPREARLSPSAARGPH